VTKPRRRPPPPQARPVMSGSGTMVIACSTIPGRAHPKPCHPSVSPWVFESSRAGLRTPHGLKPEASLVAVGAGDDAVPGDGVTLLVGIHIVIGWVIDAGNCPPARARHAPIKQSVRHRVSPSAHGVSRRRFSIGASRLSLVHLPKRPARSVICFFSVKLRVHSVRLCVELIA
jgi:hypothetical protein